MPIGEQITITAIYNNDDRRVPYAKPGEGVKVILINNADHYSFKLKVLTMRIFLEGIFSVAIGISARYAKLWNVKSIY